MTDTAAPLAFMSYSWDDAEHQAFVLRLATRLRSDGVDVVLDEWDTTLGSDLGIFMEKAGDDAYRVIAIVSDKYRLKADNAVGGVGYEKRIVVPRLMEDLRGDVVIPVLRNNTDGRLPRFMGKGKYVDMRGAVDENVAYEDLLRDLWRAPRTPKPPLGRNPFESKDDDEASQALRESPARYESPASQGTVTWFYTNNSGRFGIGAGDQRFTLYVSTAGHGSVHVLNDPGDIRSVALAPGASEPQDLSDPASYDGSSRSRVVRVGDAAVLRNARGYWASVFVDSVTTRDTDPEGEPRMTFRYVIAPRPEANLSAPPSP
ncbi:toll/interleukin-1 receptor domain-containing protein [Cellulosimicrobium funkei]|uniref:toll/interleukin-1 receptor domain-containing protein n=1 Tax=Cellulosimicrobium funkei TaxID=264251 RepID=UPI003669E1F9